jgi:RNA polymerase sigma-70 factor (ECF subfamily)
MGRFRERSTLKTWLFRIAVHVAHKHRRKRREETGLGDHAGREPADETVEASQRASRLEEAVQTLPDPMREAVLLNKILGFTYAECAQIAGCPIGTVKSRVANAMVRLRELLEAQERAD